jgi:hypothetical protein
MSSRPSPPRFDEADFKRRLTDEYKILQDKIDKIGGFRFVIKGWSVTAVIAASAAGGATGSLLTVVAISAGLALMLFFFFWFEFEQVKLSRIFGARARKLEGSFRLMDRGYGGTMTARISVPYTAHEIVESLREQRLFRWPARGAFRRRERFSRRLENWWDIIRHADAHFYLVLICIAFILALLPHYRAIDARWKQGSSAVHRSATHPGPSTGPEVGRPVARP